MQNLQNPILTFFITFPSRFTSKPQIHQPPATKLLVFTHVTIIEPGCENEEDDGVWRVIGEEAEWFPLSLSLSLSLSHLPFLRTYSATLPSHSHPQFFLLLLKRNQWIHFQTPSIPTSALKKSLSFSLTLFHFSFYICLLLIFFFFF